MLSILIVRNALGDLTQLPLCRKLRMASLHLRKFMEATMLLRASQQWHPGVDHAEGNLTDAAASKGETPLSS